MRLESPRRWKALMNAVYWLSGTVALALALYLTVALLKPEWFE